jgi:hypothetical protein
MRTTFGFASAGLDGKTSAVETQVCSSSAATNRCWTIEENLYFGSLFGFCPGQTEFYFPAERKAVSVSSNHVSQYDKKDFDNFRNRKVCRLSF